MSSQKCGSGVESRKSAIKKSPKVQELDLCLAVLMRIQKDLSYRGDENELSI